MEIRPSYPFPCRAASFGAALLLLVVLSGCSRQPGIVGKWSGSSPIGGGTAAFTYDFHDDGLVETSVKTDKAALSSTPMASVLLGDATNIHVAGSYTVKGDVLTITPKSVTLLDDKGQTPSSPITPTVTQEPQIIRYKISGTTLTLDRMDGDKPLVLNFQKGTE